MGRGCVFVVLFFIVFLFFNWLFLSFVDDSILGDGGVMDIIGVFSLFLSDIVYIKEKVKFIFKSIGMCVEIYINKFRIGILRIIFSNDI